MTVTRRTRTGPLRDRPQGQGGAPDPQRGAHLSCQAAGEDHDERAGTREDHQRQGQGQAQRQDLPHRPAFRHLVDDVRDADERCDVAGGRPHRDGQTHDRHERPDARVALELLHRVADHVPGGAGSQLSQVLQNLLGGRLPGDTEQGHQHQQGGEQCQDPVVRQRGGPVREFVVLELLQGAAQHRSPGPPGQLDQPVRRSLFDLLVEAHAALPVHVPGTVFAAGSTRLLCVCHDQRVSTAALLMFPRGHATPVAGLGGPPPGRERYMPRAPTGPRPALRTCGPGR